MKKVIFALSMAGVLFVASCSKSSSSSSTVPKGTLTAGGTTYTELWGADSVNSGFFGNTVNALVSRFSTADGKKFCDIYVYSKNTARPTAGSYNIGGSTYIMSGNQQQILFSDSSALGEGLYAPDTVTSVNAIISVVSGKISEAIPSIRLTGFFTPAGGSSYSDTIMLSGVVSEQ